MFRDPYMLDFLELADTYTERVRVRREARRITLDSDDYYLDSCAGEKRETVEYLNLDARGSMSRIT